MDDCNFETAWGADGQHMVDSICEGDNFAIVVMIHLVVNNTSLFYVTSLYLHVKRISKMGGGNDWEAGDWLLRSYWYHKKRKNSQTFVLLDTSPFAFCYFHLVFYAKLAMPLSTHKCKGSLPTYTLECKVEETILQGLVDR